MRFPSFCVKTALALLLPEIYCQKDIFGAKSALLLHFVLLEIHYRDDVFVAKCILHHFVVNCLTGSRKLLPKRHFWSKVRFPSFCVTVRRALPWPPNKLFLQVSQSRYANLINGHASLQSPTGK